MSIQGMSQGLSFSNMSYYIGERIPGIVPCTTPPLYAQSNLGAYNTSFDMGGAGSNGCAIVVMEVGDTKVSHPQTSAIHTPIGDKTRWEYKNAYGSEYSCCQMGTPLPAITSNQYRPPADLYVMKGMGYARGFIGAPYPNNAHTPISTAVGTKLTGSTTPTAGTAASGMGNGGKYLAMDNSNSSNFGGVPTGQTGPALAHGMFCGDDVYTGASVYNYDNTSNNYVVSSSKDFAGPYTGHTETEIADPNVGKAYPGSSAVTLNSDQYSTRQAMMVIPIANGGIVNVRSEQFIKGTWASLKIFCPITLPKWGLANNMMGVSEMYADSDLDDALLMNGGTSIAGATSSNSTTVTLQNNAFNSSIGVGQLVTGTGIPQGTIVSAISGTNLTLSQAASVSSGDVITFVRHPLNQKWRNYANQNSVNLPVDPANATQTQRYNFFGLLGGIIKYKPYPTAAAALSHNFSNPGSTPNYSGAKNKTAYHVPSQNSIYRAQGYSAWQSPSGGSPVSNHGSHILGNHANTPLKGNTLTSNGATADAEYFHGVPNAHDWVFSRSNGATRSRLPARGVLDRTRYADNDSATLGGWYAMRITGYFDGSNPTVQSTAVFAVQVGSLDHTRGDADIDVDSVANKVPRDGVIRTIVAA